MTYLHKNKLELIGHKTCKSMPDALKIKKKKKNRSLVGIQPWRYTSVENPKKCSDVESQLKRIGNPTFSHNCIHRLRSLVIKNKKH